jgi:FkbM family methyltransferase
MQGTLNQLPSGKMRQIGKQLLSKFIRLPDPFARESFAQEGEDLVLVRWLQSVASDGRGFYVDVGAHHPRRFSNTFYFYQRGWSGINIDPLPGTKALFDRERPRDITLEIGIAPERGNLTYYEFNEPALNGFNKNTAELRNGTDGFKLLSQRQIPCIPLAEVLAEHLPAAQQIDFLTIDAEGFDLSVLQSNDWERFRPRIVLSEFAELREMTTVDTIPFAQFLASKGYVPIARTALTLFFARADCLIETSTGYRVR